jgi:hypothetical protein
MRMYARASMVGAFGMGTEAENAGSETKRSATRTESERCIREDSRKIRGKEACESRRF